MADVILGGTLRFMLMFKMIDQRPAFTDYVQRHDNQTGPISAASRGNAAVAAEHGLKQ